MLFIVADTASCNLVYVAATHVVGGFLLSKTLPLKLSRWYRNRIKMVCGDCIFLKRELRIRCFIADVWCALYWQISQVPQPKC